MLSIRVRDHWSVAEGATIKDVRCESCQAEYVYRMERAESDAAQTVMFMDREAADRRAEDGARRNLRKALRVECDVVPCPQCGHVQAEMVRKAKREHAGSLVIVALGVMSLGGFLLFAGLVVEQGVVRKGLIPGVSLGWPIVIAGVGLFVLRILLGALHDPNDPCDRRTRMIGSRDRTLSKQEFLERRAANPVTQTTPRTPRD